MLYLTFIGASLIAVTVLLHAAVTVGWVRRLARMFGDNDGHWRAGRFLLVLVTTVLVLIALHAVEIAIWAIAYDWVLPQSELEDFETALYFSFVTFTTLGYGDITLSEGWRLLSGIEALNGLLLVGWTTALLFAIVQRGWQGVELASSSVASKDKNTGDSNNE